MCYLVDKITCLVFSSDNFLNCDCSIIYINKHSEIITVILL